MTKKRGKRTNKSMINAQHEIDVDHELLKEMRALEIEGHDFGAEDEPVEVADFVAGDFDDDIDAGRHGKVLGRNKKQIAAALNAIAYNERELYKIQNGAETPSQFNARKEHTMLNRPDNQANNKQYGKKFRVEIKWTIHDSPSSHFGTTFTLTYAPFVYYAVTSPLGPILFKVFDFPNLVKKIRGRNSVRPQVGKKYDFVHFQFKTQHYFIVVSTLNGNNGSATNTDDVDSPNDWNEIDQAIEDELNAGPISSYFYMVTPGLTTPDVLFGELFPFAGGFVFSVIIVSNGQTSLTQKLQLYNFVMSRLDYMVSVLGSYAIAYLRGDELLSQGPITWSTVNRDYEYVDSLIMVTFCSCIYPSPAIDFSSIRVTTMFDR
jgi:hypothetical protein